MSIEIIFFFKIFLVILSIMSVYAIVRNLDIIKIIIIYFKDKLFRK